MLVTRPIQVLSSDGRVDLYPQARIYTSAGALVVTLNLPHIAEGMYGSNYTFTSADYYSVVYEMYVDSGHTMSAYYEKSMETIHVAESISSELLNSILFDYLNPGSVGEAIAIIKGLVQDNFRLDQQVYNPKGLLLSCRIRLFKSKADLVAELNPFYETVIADIPKPAPDDDLSDTYTSERSP